MKDPTELQQDWKDAKEHLKQRLSVLSERDEVLLKRELELMLKKLQTKLSWAKSEVDKLLSKW